MYLDDFIYASQILEDPDMMDRVEDPYVVVRPDISWSNRHNRDKDIIRVMTLMHARGWETVNVSFLGEYGAMYALLKNPRAKLKNVGDS